MADEGTSCTAACEARGGECDAARVTDAAQSTGSCGDVLTDLGVAFDPISGQGWLGDRSGCSFGAKCGAHDYCTVSGVQCPLEHQDADMGAAYAAIDGDDKWHYKGTLKDGRPWFESDSAGDPLRYLYYSSRAGGHLLSATAPLLGADEPWVGDNNRVRLLSGSEQFPEGTWSEARVYCGHDTGPAAAGCSRHERGGDSNKAYYWCDNNGPVSVSCTCSAEDGSNAWKRVPLARFVLADDPMVGVLGSSGEVFFKGGLERGNEFRLAAIAVQIVVPHAGSYEVALTDRPGSTEFSAADDSLCKHSKITKRRNTDSFFFCTSDPRSAPYSQNRNSYKEVCQEYHCCGKSNPFDLVAGANTLWLTVREMCSLASHLTITAVQPPSALPPPSSSPRQCDMSGDNGIAAPATCADTSNGATDSHGSTCADYDDTWCGNYDDDDFTAKFMCCACDGGTVPFSASSRASVSQTSVSQKCSTYEAEDAALDPEGAMTFDDRHAGFTGTGVVAYKAREGEYIEWTVNCDAAAGCNALVSWRYALRNRYTTRYLDLNVNGRKVRTVLFPASGSDWKDYTSTKETISIALEPGSNAIRLTSIGRSGTKVDSMTVCEPLGAFDCPLDGYEYRASTRGCQCESATGQPLSTGEVCIAAGQLLGAIATAHEVLGEGACTTGDFACIDQGRRACDYVRLHSYQGSIDCFAFSLGKAGDKGGVQLLSSGASFRGDSVAPVVAPVMARMAASSTCTPDAWIGYNGKTCGECAALVNVRDNGGTCAGFCLLQGLACVEGWDDKTNDQCSIGAEVKSCDHSYGRTSDAICSCAPLPTPAPTACTDTDNGAAGMMGGCGPHMTQAICETSATMYDNDIFTASAMCCACGGGSTLDYNADTAAVSPTCLADPDGLLTDAGWSTFVAARTHLWHSEAVALASFAPVNDPTVGVLSTLALALALTL